MAKKQMTTEDPLARKAAEAERVLEFVDRTTFAGNQREVTDELSTAPQHPADIADVTMQRQVDYDIKNIASEEAEQIRAAIERRAQGRYGICADCNQPIAPERLEARPQATLCIDCQRKREGAR